eukprot:gnl/MRDRNA2_/MRDRNA2_55914_c0_seq1.p1 gnl/MRDRNA2_/MRDRNA2_55914_c0~~gnl/MRDRNA2_/MRDRNA2_55914_c0_seq1.p1  ORF type:complete len:159 (+),score=19.78 gnl/MRDRNA2_/MRDRNA2_55914_c0_seq1:91-567(+)
MMIRSLVCLMSLVVASEAVACIDPSGSNPSTGYIGEPITCKGPDGTGAEQGNDCVHVRYSGSEYRTQCDTEWVDGKPSFICEKYGNPTTCCSYAGEHYVCSGGKGFTEGATKEMFEDCKKCTPVGSGGGAGPDTSKSTIGASLSSALLLGVSVVLALH